MSAWAVEHVPLLRYLMVVLLIGGAFAFANLGQDEDPPFTFRAMVVRAYWPGASATQMAEQVTDKLEKKLQETPGIDKIRSYSKPGETLIFVQVNEATRGRDVGDAWYQVRKKIGDIRGTLPPGVQGPFFNDEFGDVYGVMFAFSTDGFTYRELKDYVEGARQRLLKVPNVAKVDLFGVQDEKVYIEISHRKLAQIGLDIPQLAAQIGAQNAVEGSGVLVLPSDNVQVRISGEFRSLDDLRQLPIRANALTYKLGDIATIARGYTDPPRDKMRAGFAGEGGREVIGLGVTMIKGGDIIRLGKDLAAVERRIEASLPVGIDMVKVADQPRAVATSVNEFLRVLVEALVIVLAVSFLTLGLHTRPLRLDVGPGLVVLATIPLVLAITMLAMWMLGINLHKISLGALIIALGLLVDDAIIAVEMMVRKLEEGASRAVRNDRDADADRHADHGRRFSSDRTREIRCRRVHDVDLPGHRAGAGDLVVRRGAVRSAARRLVAEDQTKGRCAWRRRAVRHPVLSPLSAPRRLVRRVAQDGNRDHDRCTRARNRRLPLHRAAVLSGFEPPRARRQPLAARGREPAGNRRGGARLRALARRSARARLVRQLYRNRRAAVLSAAGPAVREHEPR
jgi:Cu/Ag efflux pump CusA